jgi:hypothetical protein
VISDIGGWFGLVWLVGIIIDRLASRVARGAFVFGKFGARLLMKGIFWLVLLVSLGGSMGVSAQAVPDTSLNRVLPDTLPARNAPILSEPAPDQVAYDSLKGKMLPFQPNPKKSALYSAIFPGAGQLYNRQYWKLPIVYVGVGVAVYFLVDNTREYQRYRKGYIARINNPNVQDEFTPSSENPGRSQAELQILQNAYRKYLDMTMLFTGLGYTLQVLDALAFAHLKNFDVSQNISMDLKPVAMPNGDPGFGLVMNLR